MTRAPSPAIATLAIDVSALLADGRIAVQAAPPALVTARNAEAALGLTPRQLADTLRAMRRDPRWASEVIAVGKIRGATPAAIVGYLHAVTSPANQGDVAPANDTPASSERLARWGCARVADGGRTR